jgi:EAL domain-containing protein (putative c-di-GMP-specific phosphodiesterase class I)
MKVVFQPVVDFHSAAVVGHKALIRESIKILEPAFDRLLAAAQARHREQQFERGCLELAIRQWCHGKPKGLLFATMSANSLLQMHASEGIDALLKLLEKHQLNPERMGLEITGYSRIGDTKSLADCLRPLRTQGMVIALDDFKPSDSSMRVWGQLLPSMVKMAPRWTRHIEHNLDHQKIVRSLVRMTNKHNAMLVAKAVETEAEFRTLHQLGVGLGQGYFLGRPAPEFVRTLNVRASTAMRARHAKREPMTFTTYPTALSHGAVHP